MKPQATDETRVVGHLAVRGDALHLATFVLARRRIPDLELQTADARLRTAAGTV